MTDQEYDQLKERWEKAKTLRGKTLGLKALIYKQTFIFDNCKNDDAKAKWQEKLTATIERLNQAKKEYLEL
jgi:hypothetical protein